MIAAQTISSQSTMAEVLRVFPGAQRALFRKYHIGGCSSCGFDPGETLKGVCERNGNLDVSEVISHIEQSHQQDGQTLIEPRVLAEWIAAKTPFRLVDIRTREEWEAVRIEGSILFTQDLMTEMLGRWPREETIVIYDHLGTKSMDAAAYFLGHGFKQIRALRGGIDAWAREADPGMKRYQLQ